MPDAAVVNKRPDPEGIEDKQRRGAERAAERPEHPVENHVPDERVEPFVRVSAAARGGVPTVSKSAIVDLRSSPGALQRSQTSS